MAQSMTIKDIEHLVQRVIHRITGAKILIRDIKIIKVLNRPDDDTIAAIWFEVHNDGDISYLIDWDSNVIFITNEHNRYEHGSISFDGRY